jgi:hypothetical protein
MHRAWHSAQFRHSLTWFMLLLITTLLWMGLLPQHRWHNLGWLHMSRTLTAPAAAGWQNAADAFTRATTIAPPQPSAQRGLAWLASLQGDTARATEHWARTDQPPAQILEYGVLLHRLHGQQAALTTYRSAAPLYPTTPNPATYAALSICQGLVADLALLPGDMADYCQSGVRANQGNWIFNGQFTDGIEAGWGGQFFFARETAAAIQIDPAQGQPAPAAQAIGYQEQRHQGLFQRLCLAPGATVRFQGWFRVEAAPTTEAHLLYIGWAQAERTQGNSAQTVTQSLPWTHLQRTFTVPSEASPTFTFSPIILTGQGTVWMDDIQLHIIDTPTPDKATPFCFVHKTG